MWRVLRCACNPALCTRQAHKLFCCTVGPTRGRAVLSARIRETYRSRCKLSSKICALQSQLQSELLMEGYQKVTKLSYEAAKNTHAKAKLNQTKKLWKLMDMWDKHRGLRPQGLER